MRIRLTRESVAMGDDARAPHEEYLDMPDGTTFGQAVDRVIWQQYLARIKGGRATWLVTVGQTVHAVVAQEWATPSWLTDPDVPAPAEVHFRYLAQRDPGAVFAELSRLLPDADM